MGSVKLTDKFSTDLAIWDARVIDKLAEGFPILLAFFLVSVAKMETLKLARVLLGVGVFTGERTTKNPPLKTVSSDFSSLDTIISGITFDCFFFRAAGNIFNAK